MKKVYLFLCLLIIGSALQAQTNTWTGAAGDTVWHTAGNWSLGTVPTSTDSVNFTNTSLQIVYFTADASAKVISFSGSANVMFALKGVAASTVRTINLGGTSAEHYNNTALRFPGSTLSLTLNTNRSSGANSGINLTVLTGNKATITRTIHLSGFAPTLPAGNDSISTGQVNKIIGIDAGSVLFGNGGELRVNQRNNGTNGTVIFAGSATNGVVFQNGSTLTNNVASLLNPFNTASGDGTAQFLTGSTFNLMANTGVPIFVSGGTTASGNATFLSYFQGRTYGTFNIGKIGCFNNTVFTNSSTTTTTFLDNFNVDNDSLFQITLAGHATNVASPTFSFNNIRIRSTRSTPNTSIFIRASTTGNAATSVNISGNIDLIATSSNTTAGTIQMVVGPNGTGGSTAHTNINFTGNTTIKLTKGSTNTFPNFTIGSPSGGTTMPTNFTVNSGATLNLGDSLTLRTGNSYTKFTIKPTGRLNLIDAARFITAHNNNFLVESDTTGTGSIGSIASTGSLFQNSVTIQRFIGRNAAWRTIGIPLSTAAPTKLYGGTGTSTSFKVYMNSFTASPAQAYYFNDTLDNGQYGAGSGGANAGWRSFTTNNDSISPDRGLLLYGSRNSASPIVLSLTGFINTVDQTIPLSKTASGNGWNLIANPFLSNISFNSIVSNAANDGVLNSNTIYRVRPLGAGAYSFASYVAGSGTGTNGGSNVIENGGAFFVRAADAGKSLVIREADKTTAAVGSTDGGVTLMGANENYNSIRVSLKGANTFSDEVVFVWGRFSKATEGFDNDLDAYDLGASGTHDLSIVDKEGTRYAIFNGADLPKDAETRTYKLATKNLRLGTYEFAVSMPKALDRNNEAYLVDNYLGTAVLVKEGLSHSFQVTADAASKAEGRFQLEIRKKLTSAIDEVATSKTYLLSNPTRNNQFAIHFGSDAQVANWQVVDLSGRVIGTGMFKNVYQGDTRIGELKTLQPGTYLVRLFNDNEPTVVMKLVKL